MALLLFVAYSAAAGGNAVGVRFSNQELEPFWGATLRFTLAAALMISVMVAGRHAVPRGRALLGAVLYGLFAFGGAFAFAFYALVELEAGFGQIVLAIVPLVTLLLAAAQGQERITAPAVLGGVLALGGVAVMSGVSFSGELPVGSVLAAVGSAACFSQGALMVKRFPPVNPVSLNAVGMTAGALFLAAVTVVAGDEIALPRQADTWWAVAYMVVIGSGVVFTLYVMLLRHWDASRTNYGFVLIPIFTLLFANWLLDEPVTSGLIGGGLLVVAGVYLGALRPATDAATAPAAVE